MAQIRLGNETIDKIYDATLGAGEDQERDWRRIVLGATMRYVVRRTPTTTDGAYVGTVAILGGVGKSGDYFQKLQWEVAPGGGNAGIWLSYPLEPAAASGVTGSAIAGGTATVTFTAALSVVATKNQYAGRIARFTYVPTGGVATVFKSRIVSHPAYTSTTTLAMTLEDTPPAGSVPSEWAIEGPLSRRICEPTRAAGVYEWVGPETSNYGGYILTIGPAIVEAHALGDFT